MPAMTPAALFTLLVITLALVLLIRSRRAQDVILWGAVGLLLIVPLPVDGTWQVGVLSTAQALSGLANEGVATIAVLFVVAAGMRETGALRLIMTRTMGRPGSLFAAQHRLVWPVAALSGFLNNTPLVAMLMPATDDWARRSGFSVSKLLMPLSFASILGGACTLIGTSTNLIVNGWILEHTDLPGFGMFTISAAAVPVALVGVLFTIYGSRWLLPERIPPFRVSEDARQYTVEMIVERAGELVGRTIEQAGLRGLPGLFLVEIERNGESIPAVSGNVVLHDKDRLVFAGIVDSVLDLQKMPGLRPATNQVFKLSEPRHNRTLMEAVVSDSCPVVGRTIKEGRFRTRYNAAIIAVARNGERINRKIGDIVLRAGDTLLLETRRNFAEQQRNSRDFYLISQIANSTPVQHQLAPVALAILVLMVLLVTFNLLPMLHAGMLAGGLMLVSGCCSPGTARNSVDWQVLLVIAAALAIGNAMQISGLAELLGHLVLAVSGNDATLLLIAIFGLAMVLASVITAKAGAVLMLPIAVAAARELGVDLMPFVVAIMLASSTTVATPIGYPTNLMVFGPGGYRFTDYLRLGGPLTLIVWVMSVVLIPRIWPF